MKVETGTGGMSDVDISWIPQETLNVMSEYAICGSLQSLFACFESILIHGAPIVDTVLSDVKLALLFPSRCKCFRV